MSQRSPFEILGITEASSEEQIRAAWKSLATTHHPDVGGNHESMLLLNSALADALRLLREESSAPTAPVPPRPRKKRGASFAARDMSSFTINSLPVDAWHLLEIAAAHCGQVIDEEEPYLMEFMLHDTPFDGGHHAWCRCELVPEAGGTTIHLSIVQSSLPVITPELLRDFLVDTINEVSDI